MNGSKASQTNRVLRVILCAFLVIVLRIWHLSTVQREERLIEAKRPQERTLLLKADRGILVDRFGIPLAENKICYNAAVYYNQIAQIPVIAWQNGVRTTPRREYVLELSHILAKELGLDPLRVEDEIHSRASLFPHVPYLLKSHLSELEHYRLKMLEKDWVGVHAEISSERFYPLGPVACNVIGRMGSISSREYRAIAAEMAELQDVREWGADEGRLSELKERAYTLTDLIGKTGVEGQFEEDLRGFYGKKTLEVDQKGRYLRELPGGREAVAGKKITLSISAELQQFAEELLTEDEKRRQKLFWMKGGAIVALDPNTGEILALASYPRFDPNDFIPAIHPVERKRKQERACRWLENERFIGAVWDGKEPLQREREEKRLTWEFYLELVTPPESAARLFFSKPVDLKTALQPQTDPFIEDLCQLCLDRSRFNEALASQYGSMKLSTYRALNQEFLRQEASLKEEAVLAFRQEEFLQWRQGHQKDFLAEKRREEKEKKTYARPYLDYLEAKEKELFAIFWAEKRLPLLAKKMGLPESLLATFRSFAELGAPQKDLATAFYPPGGFGFTRSYAFQVASPPGSWFKLVTGYEGLQQGLHGLTLIDQTQSDSVARMLSGTPYPRIYKGGRLPRSHAPDLGRVDFIGALEQSSNPYFAILAGDYLKDPEDLARAARRFGLGEKSGIELPGEARGMVPTDLRTNRTGLYSTAIGQHTLLATPLQCALQIATIANGGHLLRPKITLELSGLSPNRQPLTAFACSSYLGKEELALLGIPFPLFTAAQERAADAGTAAGPMEIRRILPLSSQVRNQLLTGMDQAVWGPKGNARAAVIRQLWADPIAMQGYLSLEHQMLAKTGTAEILCNPYRAPGSVPKMFKHVWCGATAFPSSVWTDPEIVVVTFLRYGDGGKDAAPLAAKMIRKWREIRAKHGS